MPYPTLFPPLYAAVPIAAGVPPLNRIASTVITAVSEITSDLTQLSNLLTGPRWGLFSSDGDLVLHGDSVETFEFSRSYNVPSYPIEMGGFSSYNKVERPYDVKIKFMIGQTEQDRTQFLYAVDGVCASTDLFVALTPEAAYIDINPIGYGYRRTRENGCTILHVEVACIKIRQSAVSTYGNTKQPDGADPKDDGPVQPSNSGSNDNSAVQLDVNAIQKGMQDAEPGYTPQPPINASDLSGQASTPSYAAPAGD